jgi:hypothetical protein
MTFVAPLGCHPCKKPPKETQAKPKRDIESEDEKEVAGMLSNLHTYENAAHDQAPLQYANAPDKAPFAFRPGFCPLQRTFGLQ